MPIDPDLAILITEIDANLSHLESLTHGLTNEQFGWRPGEAQWSMGECIAHLNIANGRDLRLIEETISRAKARGVKGEGPFTYGLLSRKFVASQEAGNPKKFKAPKSFQPAAANDLDQTIAEYRRVASELQRLMREANGLHLAKVKMPLTALPAAVRWIMKMPLGARFALIAAHDRRHLYQAEEVRNHANFPVVAS